MPRKQHTRTPREFSYLAKFPFRPPRVSPFADSIKKRRRVKRVIRVIVSPIHRSFVRSLAAMVDRPSLGRSFINNRPAQNFHIVDTAFYQFCELQTNVSPLRRQYRRVFFFCGKINEHVRFTASSNVLILARSCEYGIFYD